MCRPFQRVNLGRCTDPIWPQCINDAALQPALMEPSLREINFTDVNRDDSETMLWLLDREFELWIDGKFQGELPWWA